MYKLFWTALLQPNSSKTAEKLCGRSGGLLIASTVLRPLLPVLVPGHISGALTVVITLRFVFNAEELSRLKSNYWYERLLQYVRVCVAHGFFWCGCMVFVCGSCFVFVYSAKKNQVVELTFLAGRRHPNMSMWNAVDASSTDFEVPRPAGYVCRYRRKSHRVLLSLWRLQTLGYTLSCAFTLEPPSAMPFVILSLLVGKTWITGSSPL